MSNVINFDAQNEPHDEASLWLAKMDRGLSPTEVEQLQRWLSDAANRGALLEMTELWDKMDSLSWLAELFPNDEHQPRARPRAVFALAASFLLVALLVGTWNLIEFRSSPNSTIVATEAIPLIYETAIGEQSTITLSDGTQITLNTNSSVTVNYSNQQRLLRLHRGQLLVAAAHDPSRPLSVLAHDRIVQAVGTEFSLEITDDQQIELIVTDGRVLVGIVEGSDSPDSSNAPTLLVESPLTAVNASQEIVLGSSEEEVRTLTPDEIEVRLSWRDGNLVFQGESLEEAVAEIGRYSMVEFIFLDEGVKHVRVAGRFRAGDVDALLSALRENFDITYERVGDDTILLSGQ